MKKLVIIGASGHGKVIADIALKTGYEEIVFLDDDDSVKTCAGFPVVGNSEMISEYNDWDFVVAIGNVQIRERLTDELANYSLATLIHPDAVIGREVEIGRGTVIMAGAVINSYTKIGRGCIINTCSSVDHDCNIGDFVHVAVGSHICGTVNVGTSTWIGAGSTVSNNIDICGNCKIGVGAVVIKNIEEVGTYIGVPAKKIR
ncbi:MAG: acetyltransferase [Ruminococcus sp.]|nr:acetyltransferase [Ruminococcus sp.]